ncbi:MAG: hypothetical protein JWO22_2909 [Frankiales bacterium]|nr:hypothetical protein [Frankiales bacterium]
MSRPGRVLVVGPSCVGEMAWFLALGYRRLGWQVARVSDRAFIGRGLPGLVGKAVQLTERDHRLTSRSRKLGELVRERARGCDHVVTVKGEYFLPEDVAAINAVAPIVNWHPDHPVIAQNFACIPYYTAFCPKDSWSTARLRAMGHLNVSTLPHASDPLVLGSDRSAFATTGFSVVGTGYAYRQHWIDEARGVGLDVRLWGTSRTPRELRDRTQKAKAVGPDQGKALRSGFFTLNTHHPYDIAGGNQRVFDAAAAGAPQLTECLPETVRHFLPGEEIATFADRDEFVAQVKELSADAALRGRLSANSLERVRAEHTYEHRVQSILSML